jgi:hypothetical protein
MILTLVRGSITDPLQLANWISENTATIVAPVPMSACILHLDGGSSGTHAPIDPNVNTALNLIPAQKH